MNVAEEFMSVGCMIGDRINGLVDGISLGKLQSYTRDFSLLFSSTSSSFGKRCQLVSL
ncbi:hypothetical protein MTR_5g017390 [Medicago truncatula]|uniref:Uncharacterized protein n=1 Tax=Medicago truncatula TaxID=3880 RepID=G7K6P4_MEDTR|nr:hypothetical protein MTR_5g017390 [Medicago truncatula]